MDSQELSMVSPELIEFTWDIIYRCNYRCSYCWWDPMWDSFEKRFPEYPSWERWLEAWRRVFDKYGPASVSISGGEPFSYPSFEDLLEGLSRMHQVLVTTNLSISRSRLERLARAPDPEKVVISGSFHPEFADFAEFMDKMEFLRGAGIRGSVLVVAHPKFLEDLPRYEERCRRSSIPFTVWVFRGTFQGKAYPEGYASHERRQLRPLLGDQAREKYQMERSSTVGKLCYSGRYYANVKADGTAYRCGTAMGLGTKLGNLLDADFSLFPGPSPCPAQRCNCQEYQYLQEEYDRVHA